MQVAMPAKKATGGTGAVGGGSEGRGGMQNRFLTRCEWGQRLAFHPLACYMYGAVSAEGDLGAVRE